MSWRDDILKYFVPGISKLTLIADPDGLFTEEKLALQLRERGFDLIEFNDSVEFRYAYESKYGSSFGGGVQTDLLVIARMQESMLSTIPYDLYKNTRKLSFSLGELFPNLSYPVIETLDRNLLDTLFKAQLRSNSERMGDNATKDFLLRILFGISTDLIKNDIELLRVLLSLHYKKPHVPRLLLDRMVKVLKEHALFNGWPLEKIVIDGEAFFEFLQERWPIFLDQLALRQQGDNDSKYVLKYKGPKDLPFGHEDVRVYVDSLFIEGKLAPVRNPGISADVGLWVKSGLIVDGTDNDNTTRSKRLMELIEKELPTLDSRYSDWMAFGLRWGELSSLIYSGVKSEIKTKFDRIAQQLNQTFTRWLNVHYSSLINLPPTTPAMLHHVPRRLARELEEATDTRVALIVVDGLAMDQWVTIRKILQMQNRSIVMRESAVFAWIPTITSVSRQALFSGRSPLYFSSTINTTNKEEQQWKRFWETIGLSRLDIAYHRGLGDGDVVSILNDAFHPTKTKVAGLIIDKVDKIMHGMQLGSEGMHNQLKQWCHTGFLGELISYLLGYGYQVWLTSDHGNIECHGIGRPSEGVVAEMRGQRVRVYSSVELRDAASSRYPSTAPWPSIGLPPDYFPLVATGSGAFIKPNESIVGHGGITFEEVIVPLVKFERRGQ